MAKPRRTPQEIEELKTAVLELDGELGGSNKAIAEALNAQGLTNLSGGPWTGVLVGAFKQRHLAVPKTARATATTNDMPTVDLEPELTEDREEGTESDASNIPVTDLPEAFSDSAEDEEPASTFSDIPTTPLTAESIIGRVQIKPAENAESAKLETHNIPVTDASAHTLPDDLVDLLTEIHENGELAALLTWWKSEKGGQPMDKPTRPRFVGERVNSGLLVNRTLKDRAFAKAKHQNMSLSQLTEWLYWRFLGEPSDCLEE